jgi:hypothetical protein
MTIYQVVNEQNHLMYAFLSLDIAAQEVEMLNENGEEHYYFVNPIELIED